MAQNSNEGRLMAVDPNPAYGVEPSAMPTNKVMAAAVTAVVVFLVTKLGLKWNPIYEQALNAILPLVVAYFTRNKPTPGGVPLKS
jgi:hypothetical protein